MFPMQLLFMLAPADFPNLQQILLRGYPTRLRSLRRPYRPELSLVFLSKRPSVVILKVSLGVLLVCYPLEVVAVVIGSIVVDVVHKGQVIRVWYKGHRNQSMYVYPLKVGRSIKVDTRVARVIHRWFQDISGLRSAFPSRDTFYNPCVAHHIGLFESLEWHGFPAHKLNYNIAGGWD